MSSIDANIKYKIEKAADRNLKKFVARIAAEQIKYVKLRDAQIEKINVRYNKKFNTMKNRIYKQYERKRIDGKKKLLGKEVKKEGPKLSKMKSEALRQIQLYAKISRADENGMVKQIDTGRLVHWTKCVGGHIYSQRNYPQLAFNVDNIRPISSMGNKRQMENTADWIDRTPLTKIQKDTLKLLSTCSDEKNFIRDRRFFELIAEQYKKFNENILNCFPKKST